MRLFSTALLAGAAFVFNGGAFAGALTNHDYKIDRQNSSILSVSASKDEAAENFINSMASEAIAFIGNAELSEKDKEQKFSTLLTRSFDMPTIGRFALGKYWRVATPEQRDEYQSLFRDMIVKVYTRRFSDYNGQKLAVRDSRTGEGDDIIVSSFIVPKNSGQEVQVDWRLRNKNGQYKVIDVVVEGVSMALTQRSDFSSVIQRGGGDVAVLLNHLRNQK